MKELKPIFELRFWQNLIQSPDWKYLLNIFTEHKNHLNHMTCQSVSEGKLDEAVRYQAKAEDVSQIISLMTQRIKELERRCRDNGSEEEEING